MGGAGGPLSPLLPATVSLAHLHWGHCLAWFPPLRPPLSCRTPPGAASREPQPHLVLEGGCASAVRTGPGPLTLLRARVATATEGSQGQAHKGRSPETEGLGFHQWQQREVAAPLREPGSSPAAFPGQDPGGGGGRLRCLTPSAPGGLAWQEAVTPWGGGSSRGAPGPALGCLPAASAPGSHISVISQSALRAVGRRGGFQNST